VHNSNAQRAVQYTAGLTYGATASSPHNSSIATYIDSHSSPSYTTAAMPGPSSSSSGLHTNGAHSPTLYANKRLHDNKPYSRPERLYTTASIVDQDEQLDLSRAVDLPSPPDSPSYSTSTSSGSGSQQRRRCISCGSDQSPCWRPSWSSTAGQLCNSCGLRYKKTGARCINPECGRIPAKGEWATMKNRAVKDGHGKMAYSCLACGGQVGVGER
jgi:transcriptional regulatory protein ASH1